MMCKPQSKEELRSAIAEAMSRQGPAADLNAIDVSAVRDMSYLFSRSVFVGDIRRWDVSQVRSMRSMFQDAAFDGDISSWDVSGVMDFRAMFRRSAFSHDLTGYLRGWFGWRFHPQAKRMLMYRHSAWELANPRRRRVSSNEGCDDGLLSLFFYKFCDRLIYSILDHLF